LKDDKMVFINPTLLCEELKWARDNQK
jgi:hypothetical protein